MNISNLLKILLPAKNINFSHIKPEQKLCIDIANHLRKVTIEDNFSYVWFHVPNEFSSYNPVYGLKMGWMGRIAGVADFCFVGKDKSLFLEIKTGKVKQSPSQKIFKEWCDEKQVSYHLAYSFEEAIHIINTFLL